MDIGNDTLLGKQLGVYQIQASLGQGGMARVYKAYHPHLRREVAIKVILAERADLANFQARFKLEAQMIASLDHPNIVRVYDFGEQDDLAYLVMQYVSGGTLRNQLRPGQPLEPLRATSYAIQMARALHHAHQHGIIHRDVKPQNMLLSSSDPNLLLLSDFGIAKLYAQSDDTPVLTEMPTRNIVDPELSSASQIIGTADYMAPEQARGQGVDARTDVYALGVVLFQMLTGTKPFQAASIHGLLVQHVVTPAPWVSANNPRVPEILAQITAKALAKAPSERFQSAEEMAKALEQANSYATHRLMTFSSQATQHPPASFPGWTTPGASPTTISPIPVRPSPQTNPPSFNTSSYQSGQTPNSITPITGAQVLAAQTTASAPLHPRAARTRQLWTYALLALVVIAGVVLLSLRVFPSSVNNSAGSSSNTALNAPAGDTTAQAFHEHFQNNERNWQVGAVTSGVTLSTPGAGVYSATITASTTVFPYPQAIGLLPTTFTLSATLQRTSGALDDLYGLAFRFAQASNGTVKCYAFVINDRGQYAIYEYKDSIKPISITAGTYKTSDGAHILEVQARDSSYTFVLDHQLIPLATGSQPTSTSWKNADLNAGQLALFFAGPNKGEGSTTYQATDVELSIP